MLSHRALLQGRLQHAGEQAEWNRWQDEDVSLVAMPVAHIGGTGWGISGIHNGAKGVIAREFDPNAVIGFIEDFRISKLFMVPAAMQMIESQHTHGTGCTLASACAAGLASGLPLEDAVERAIAYTAEAIRRAPGFGAGHGPLDHGWPLRG